MTDREAMKLALEALVIAEAGLADIGDADREPDDDLAWCEARAAEALAAPRAAITALRERLAQPEQEPVALEIVYETIIKWDEGGGKRSRRELARRIIALYTAQPQRKPLTDDEIDALMPVADGSAETDVVPVEVSPGLWGKEYSEVDAWSRPLVFQIARAIEAAHGIKEEA